VKRRWRKYGNPVERGGRYFVLIDHAGLGSTFSPIPTIRHLGPFALCLWDNSGCRAFHSSTALITTTSLIVFKNSVKVLVAVIEVVKNSGVQVAPAWCLAGKIPTYFHRVSATSGLYTFDKSEYSTTAVEERRGA